MSLQTTSWSVQEEQVLRAGLYARVATLEPKPEGHSIEDQLRVAREFAAGQGWRVVREYTDPGYSGASDQRPAFQQMVQDALKGEIDVIVVSSVDRLFRPLHLLLHYLVLLHRHGIRLVSATGPFDLNEMAERIAPLIDWLEG